MLFRDGGEKLATFLYDVVFRIGLFDEFGHDLRVIGKVICAECEFWRKSG